MKTYTPMFKIITDTVRESNAPHSAIAPSDLEAFIVLDRAKEYPGDNKRLLALRSEMLLNSPSDRRFLAFIDSLVSSTYLYKHDYKYYLTPTGEKRLVLLKQQLRTILMRVL